MAEGRIAVALTLFGLTMAACSLAVSEETLPPAALQAAPATAPATADSAPPPDSVAPDATAAPPSTTTTSTTTTTVSPFARPPWLGTRVLPPRSDGFGEVADTPAELIDRRLATPSLLPPPPSGEFEFSAGEVPSEVLARSSWHADCPIAAADLAYITVSHYGFDEEVHTGEMIVAGSAADAVIGVFGKLFEARFPIEEMRVITAEEIDAAPTGDGNVTTSFSCRPAVNSGNWSQHTYGLAIDINPFHNPYIKRDLVIPELASFYLDRDLKLPGMVDGTIVVDAFAEIGWKWGGNWSSLKDWMHFSANGH